MEVYDSDVDALMHWRSRVREMIAILGWPEQRLVARLHRGGAQLALTAPEDQLFVATEVNEWAWWGVLAERGRIEPPLSPGFPSLRSEESAQQTLRRMAAAEKSPTLLALLDGASRHGLPILLDDEELSIGAGDGSLTWPLPALPGDPPWAELHDIPTALVTGSNGKTTTVRLLSALLQAQGRGPGFNCTDGIFIDGEVVARGDYSGPAGARRVLRDRRVRSAVLETARGGILRRGLAVRRADAAIVTNISEDHFGEYGIHDLGDLADTKLVVARTIGPQGCLVLNADDDTLRAKADRLDCPLAWFSLDHEHPVLRAHRLAGGSTCGIADGELWMRHRGSTHRLGVVRDLPLTLNGAARYNLSNLAGAALLAAVMGVDADTIATVFARFGGVRGDNPGRLERWTIDGVQLLVDYAHNPDGLAGLLQVARTLRGASSGRIGLLLGQAGNREDEAIRALARTAAEFTPDAVILKDIDGFLRGRQPGEVPGILRSELLRSGIEETRLRTVLPELEAAQALLAWAQPDDVLVLPVHTLSVRDRLEAWLAAGAGTSR